MFSILSSRLFCWRLSLHPDNHGMNRLQGPWSHESIGAPESLDILAHGSTETRNHSSNQFFYIGFHDHSQSFLEVFWKLRGWKSGSGIQYRLTERAAWPPSKFSDLAGGNLSQKPFLVHPRWHQVWDPAHFHIFQCRYAVCREKPANSASDIHGAMLPQVAGPESRTKWSFISARRSGWNGAITCVLVMQCLLFKNYLARL